MSNEVSISELKEKFSTLQTVTQSLKDEKISAESEIHTLDTDLKEREAEFMKKLGASSMEEAKRILAEKQEKLNLDKLEMEQKLDNYLDTVSVEE